MANVVQRTLKHGVGYQAWERYDHEGTWYIYASFAAGGDAYSAALKGFETSGYPHGVFKRRRRNGLTSWVLEHAYYKGEEVEEPERPICKTDFYGTEDGTIVMVS